MDKKIGKVIHFYAHVPAVVIKLDAPLKVGDKVHFLGHGTDLVETVTSMELDHKATSDAKAGTEVAIKVSGKIKSGTEVFLTE